MIQPFADDADAWAAPLRDISDIEQPQRRKRSSTLGERAARAMRRQGALFLALAITVALVGGAYAYFTDGGRDAFLIWLGFAVLVSLAAAISRELSRDAIQSARRLGHIPLLGASPRLSSHELRALPPDVRHPRGCITYYPASDFAAAYRELDANIGDAHVIAFVGAIPNEGATTAALAFALGAAQQGRRAIVIDCDVRRRSLTRQLLPYEPDFGVMEVAAEPNSWSSVVEHEGETGLHFIPAAKPRSAWRQGLNHHGLFDTLEHLRKHYEVIVLDCPPALTAADAAIIARQADKRVVVATWDETPVSAVRGALRALRHYPPIPTGVLLNRVPASFRY